ncbi:MAG: type III-A CRISPR-associated protein Cas10/Csm1 [Candidatus Jettenia sp. CY-1]|nr:MAG: type III-A CRISPR-associated protein Cas10/Csm1 [Candidatus Jettenia sp. CY-1]
MNDDFLSIVKGALLHDIGKVIQRADDNPTKKTHREFGYEWLLKNSGDKIAARAANTHHKEDDGVFDTNNGLIWYQADNLASSERKGKEGAEEGKWHSEVAITSPFCKIRNPNNLDQNPPSAFLSLLKKENGIDEACKKEPVITKDDYKKLLHNFEHDFNNFEVQKPHSIDFLLMLFEKHFSGVPSITMKIYGGLNKEEVKNKHPDISLYDHSKITAAIAGCMYHYCKEIYPEKWNKNELLKDEILDVPKNVEPYLLIGGDVSGVQKFIYTISSKGALKSLKGRSFFLELLTEHIISELLDKLNLTRCNLIFSGGGHFYILSHNTSSVEETIQAIKDRIDDYLFKEFQGNLQLHLESLNFHPGEFEDTSRLWRGLSEKLEQSKKKKWQYRLAEALKVEMPHPDCLKQSCEICFREDLPLIILPKGNENLLVCEPCYNQHLIGEMLVEISKGEYPVLYKLSLAPQDKFIRIENIYYQLKKGWDKSMHLDAVAAYRINDLTAKHYSHPKSVYLPLGIYQHDNLRELSDASSVFGISRIAVLRMDVDNLGKIFSKAVPEGYRTFSRMASISRNLNNFFKYCLNTIVEGRDIDEPSDIVERKVKEKGRMLSIVYSGGDDLFVIGHWLDVTEAAFDINTCFEKYTGNPFISISGGIAINEEKYPVYQYAKDAEDGEKEAKKEKDSITLFAGKCFKWGDVEEIIKRVKLFTRFLKRHETFFAVDEDRIPKTFFYRLLALSRQFTEEGVLVLPKAAYLISRIKLKGNAEDILKLKEVIMVHNADEWRITRASVLWTLMLMRKGGGKNAGI